MSHGECDDWWDSLDAPHWFVEYIEHLGVISRNDPLEKVKETVLFEYKVFCKCKEVWSNHG